ncbi:MAG: hypothetical protein GWN16_11120 [Calditrichae bacterium]|nr:hypothetical protein [Calditrichia bacterium]
MQAIKNINFGSLVIASLAGGWMMYFVDKWFAGFLGLFGLFPGMGSWEWMLGHHVESIIFAIPFAWTAIYNKLPGGGWLKGIIYGILFWLVFPFIVGLIAGALGAEPFRQMTAGSAGSFISVILAHVIYGFFLGALYNPPQQSAV